METKELGRKVRIYRSWFGFIDLDVGCWAVGWGFDIAPATLFFELGPFFIGLERGEPPPENYHALPDWSFMLHRLVIRKWRLELRVECDLNIWKFGYAMADSRDHGVYVGPLNVQIEHNKFFDQPWPTPADAFGLFLKVFLIWLDAAASRLSIPVREKPYKGQRIGLAFDGITPIIGGFVSTRELIVSVDYEGQNWDTLLNLDVKPRHRHRGGYFCEHCKPGHRRAFPNLEALWRDHLFESFLSWVNDELAVADVIGLYGSPSRGYTYAKLLGERDPARDAADHVIVLRTLKPAV